MIPKIIHYCWLSDDTYPELIKRCIASWKKNLPDYELILWNKDKIKIDSNSWLKQTYSVKKYAFAADYIRFYALYNYGGIYLDADVEVLKSFDPLLNQVEFLGSEASGDVEAAVMGTEKGLPWVKECLDYYQNREFIIKPGVFDMRPVPLLVNEKIKNKKIELKPFEYFSPKDYNIGKIFITPNTYCIHHFDGKWVKKGLKYQIKILIHRTLYFFFHRKGHNKIVHLIRKFK